MGLQTSSVLRSSDPTAASTRAAARAHHDRAVRSAGNGSLMRTAPVALAHLHDEPRLIEAARAVSALTHVEQDAQDACVLWCLTIRHTVLTGALDIGIGLPHVRGACGCGGSTAAEALRRVEGVLPSSRPTASLRQAFLEGCTA